MTANKTRKRLILFGKQVAIPTHEFEKIVVTMRRSDKLSDTTKGVGEDELLRMLAVEKHSKNRVFVIERLYIKYKKARERREKIELLT